jgi:hypothetical protein
VYKDGDDGDVHILVDLVGNGGLRGRIGGLLGEMGVRDRVEMEEMGDVEEMRMKCENEGCICGLRAMQSR